MIENETLSYKKLFSFFLPLGFSASLTGITHLIINGTLSRGENGTFIIACYAVALSLFGMIENPIIIFRQTSSTLIKDIKSFKTLVIFMGGVMCVIMTLCLLLDFSPLGSWVYVKLFNADTGMVKVISRTFRVITFVILLSGIRGIYQGIIIKQLATKWLTMCVIVRLIVMFLAAYLFVSFHFISSQSGAILFLLGMLVEAIISVWKGQSILSSQFNNAESSLDLKKIIKFYLPLLFYFIFQTILSPIILIFLAKVDNIQLGIASYTLALSITQLILSFFTYTHQLVLQLFKVDKQKVFRFMIIMSIIPGAILLLLCYTPLGFWFMRVVMGANEKLSLATLVVLQFFIVRALVFPWFDFLNGILMLYRNTKRMLIAQVIKIIFVICLLMYLVRNFADWNGSLGAVASSVGDIIGIIFVGIIVYFTVKKGENADLKYEKKYNKA